MTGRPRTLLDSYCERCSKAFRPKDKTRFCSRECYDADRIERSIKRRSKACLYCNNPFVVPYGHTLTDYCSRDCANKAHQKAQEETCNYCGVIFLPLGVNPRKYCSKACYDASRSAHDRKRKCTQCDQVFTPARREQFCSRKCAGLSQRKYQEKPCLICGTPVYPKNGRHYCSATCYGVACQSTKSRSGHEFTHAQRRQIKNRDGQCCVRCGSRHRLHIDHIVPIALGGTNNADNGQTLCRKCHHEKTSLDVKEMHRQGKLRVKLLSRCG